MRRRRAPRPLATAIGEALERAEPATLLAAVQSAWPAAVGEAIAREATPVTERSGVVTVACSSFSPLTMSVPCSSSATTSFCSR